MQQLNTGNVVNINVEGVEEKNSTVTEPGINNSINPINKVVGIIPKMDLSHIKVVKKDGTLEEYNVEKVINAVKKSAERALVEFTDKEIENLDLTYKYIWKTVNLPNTIFACIMEFCCY